MLIEEAKWLGDHLCRLGQEHFPMVNIGSSTGVFREQIQPHIDEFIFKQLREQGKKVLHADIKDAEGVDIIGDLNDADFISQLKSLGIKSILCSNLLEHVIDPQSICKQLGQIILSGGVIIVTVPYIYPYHKDPIDTKFRPSVSELCMYFPDYSLVKGEIVVSSGSQAKTLWKYLRQGKLLNIFNTLKRWILPLRGTDEWKKAATDIPNLFKSYQETCIIIQKQSKHE